MESREVLTRLLVRMNDLKAACVDASRKTGLSGWSVGQHIEHLVKTNSAIAGLLARPWSQDPSVKPAGFRALIVLKMGYIPRGRAQAPEIVVPVMTDYARLGEDVEKAKGELAALEPKLPEIERDTILFNHPVLGGFTKAQWLRFIEVHTDHHWKIIQEIRAA